MTLLLHLPSYWRRCCCRVVTGVVVVVGDVAAGLGVVVLSPFNFSISLLCRSFWRCKMATLDSWTSFAIVFINFFSWSMFPFTFILPIKSFALLLLDSMVVIWEHLLWLPTTELEFCRTSWTIFGRLNGADCWCADKSCCSPKLPINLSSSSSGRSLLGNVLVWLTCSGFTGCWSMNSWFTVKWKIRN